MFIKIEDDCLHVEKRSFPARDGKPARDTYKQKAWLYLTGDKYPKEIFVPLQSEQPMPLGTYEIHDASFSVGRYGDLGINPFEQSWTMVKDSKDKAVGAQ